MDRPNAPRCGDLGLSPDESTKSGDLVGVRDHVVDGERTTRPERLDEVRPVAPDRAGGYRPKLSTDPTMTEARPVEIDPPERRLNA